MLLLCCWLMLPSAALADGSWSMHQEPYILGEKAYVHLPPDDGFVQNGIASWYGPPFHGRCTANGERFDMHSLTAAHKTLPMDTVVLVKNLENGKKTVVRINDRGPFIGGRILDLSYKAARALGLSHHGTAKVRIIALAEGERGENGEMLRILPRNLKEGEFYVQIGSFAKHSNAQRLQRRFAAAGHTAMIHDVARPEDLLYRVHVYVGKTLQAARAAEKALSERGYKGAFVIAR